MSKCTVMIEKRKKVFVVCGREHEEGKTHYNGLSPHVSSNKESE